jgi:hypothetical protein
LALINTTNLQYSKPLLFISYLLLLIIYLNRMKRTEAVTLHFNILLVILFYLVSYLLLAFSKSYTFDNRYFGFLISPTVFSVYFEIIFVITYCLMSGRIYRTAFFIISLLLLLFTQTRINILILTFVPLIVFLLEKELVSKRKIIFLALAIFIFVYPLYQILLEVDFVREFLLGRYNDGRDASFGMRYYLYVKSLQLIQDASWFELLFGRGSEFARIYIFDLTGEDSYSHNDFLRLIIDFGLVFTILYFILIIRISLKNKMSVIIFILYLSSFYHNMVFDFYVVSCLMMCSILQVSFKYSFKT